jgi:hypothetical protein
MIPIGAFAKGGGSPSAAADPALALGSLLSAIDVRATASISATGGVAHGNPIDSITPVAGSHLTALTQTGSARPLLSNALAAGLLAARFAGGQHLTQTAPGSAVTTICALVRVPASAGAGAGPILTRDTSASSDFPAFEIRGA